MVAVTVILSVTAVPGSAVGRPVGGVSVGSTRSRAAGPCRRRRGRGRCRWQPASVQVVGLSSSITCRTHTHTRHLAAHLAQFSTLQGARASRVGGRWICGNVSDADAGDTTRGRARWVWAYCCSPLICTPGAGGSQCVYRERTQEQAARSAGVRRPKVTVL